MLWLAGVVLVCGALLLTDRLLWAPGLTEENVRRIKLGMTLEQVEGLLGGRATWEMDARDEQGGVSRGYRWLRHWKAEGAAVDVAFFEDGRGMAVGGYGRPQLRVPLPAGHHNAPCVDKLPGEALEPSLAGWRAFRECLARQRLPRAG